MEEYTTAAGEAQNEFVERRSRFIGHIAPVETEEAAAAFVARLKSEYWDASHNVYAYRLRDGAQRFSDDGEPQGTAGIPVLDVLQKEGLTDVAVVVTRYFGGVLLGAGGLVRAYSHGAKLAVDAAGKKVMCRCAELAVECGYDFYGKLTRMLQGCRVRVLDSDFGAEVRVRLLLRECDVERFCAELTELSAGGLSPARLGERWGEL